MQEFTAMILAAGLGIRMGARGRLTPKGLIPLGGAPLVPQSVETLRRAGAGRIVVVTGHLPEQYQEAFAGTEVELIHNPAYDTTGSLKTLATGLAHVDGPVAILESDLIYAPQVLDALDARRSCFTVSGPTGAGDEVYTWVDGAREGQLLRLISKDLGASDAPPLGEMIGVTGLTAADAALMRDLAPAVLAESPGAHYEDGLVALAARADIHCAFFPDIAWAEVDDEQMLARAERDVYPRIEAARLAAWGQPRAGGA